MTAASEELSVTSLNPNLVFEETFEGPEPFSTASTLDTGGWEYALQFVPNESYPGPVFQGSKAARFEIRIDQPKVESGTRSEATIVRGVDGDITNNAWYSFAVNLPSVGYEYDVERDCLNQWKTEGTPATTFRTQRDRFLLESGNTTSSRKQIDLGPIFKDNWIEFVFHFIHSYGSDGLIEVWRNGVKVLTHTGGNMYKGELPRWKVGTYKASWDLVTRRVAFYDNIRVGNANAAFADMTSGVALPPPPPPLYPQQVVSYTLVNATTDQDITEITNGATISLSAIGTTKLNIRANTDPANPAGGCVSMKLSGASSKSAVDDKAPFALYGDNGSGDYVAWSAKTGKYTLKATPYSGTKSSIGSTTGLEHSISFTIVK